MHRKKMMVDPFRYFETPDSTPVHPGAFYLYAHAIDGVDSVSVLSSIDTDSLTPDELTQAKQNLVDKYPSLDMSKIQAIKMTAVTGHFSLYGEDLVSGKMITIQTDFRIRAT